jgi:hypothetical protein
MFSKLLNRFERSFENVFLTTKKQSCDFVMAANNVNNNKFL